MISTVIFGCPAFFRRPRRPMKPKNGFIGRKPPGFEFPSGFKKMNKIDLLLKFSKKAGGGFRGGRGVGRPERAPKEGRATENAVDFSSKKYIKNEKTKRR